jgi:hypothetical protein
MIPETRMIPALQSAFKHLAWRLAKRQRYTMWLNISAWHLRPLAGKRKAQSVCKSCAEKSGQPQYSIFLGILLSIAALQATSILLYSS